MTLTEIQDVLKNKIDIYEDLLYKTTVVDDIKYNVKVILSKRTDTGCWLEVKDDYSPFQFGQEIVYDSLTEDELKEYIYNSVKQIFKVTEEIDTLNTESEVSQIEDEECY